jgi:hypothetical protein
MRMVTNGRTGHGGSARRPPGREAGMAGADAKDAKAGRGIDDRGGGGGAGCGAGRGDELPVHPTG